MTKMIKKLPEIDAIQFDPSNKNLQKDIESISDSLPVTVLSTDQKGENVVMFGKFPLSIRPGEWIVRLGVNHYITVTDADLHEKYEVK